MSDGTMDLLVSKDDNILKTSMCIFYDGERNLVKSK